VNPKEATPERTKYVSENRLELKMGISQEMFEEFKRVQDLESKRTSKTASMEETLHALLKVYLDVKDPMKRAERILSVPGRVNQLSRSTKGPAAIVKYQIIKRDKGCCTYRDKNGNRCENTRWTEIHHILPRSKGGDHRLENLTTLCSTHHKHVHTRAESA
jgi:hypothetical protein